MSSIFKLGEGQKVGVYGPASIYGADGDGIEQAILFDGTSGAKIESGIDRVDFAGNSSDYTFKVAAGYLAVLDAAGEIVSQIKIEDGGEKLVFANGSVTTTINADTGVVTLGDQEIAANQNDAVVYDGSGLNVDETSDAVASGGEGGGEESTGEYTLLEALELYANNRLPDEYTLTDTEVVDLSVEQAANAPAVIKEATNATDYIEYNLVGTIAELMTAGKDVVEGANGQIVEDTIANYNNAAYKPTSDTVEYKLEGEQSGDYITVQNAGELSVFKDAKGFSALNIGTELEGATTVSGLVAVAGGDGYDAIHLNTNMHGQEIVLFAGAVSKFDSETEIWEQSEDVEGDQQWLDGVTTVLTDKGYKDTSKTFDAMENANLLDWGGNQKATLVCSNIKDTIRMQSASTAEGIAENAKLNIHQFDAKSDVLLYAFNNAGKSTADLTADQINDNAILTKDGGVWTVVFNARGAFGGDAIDNAALLDTSLNIVLHGVQNFDANLAVSELFGVPAA